LAVRNVSPAYGIMTTGNASYSLGIGSEVWR